VSVVRAADLHRVFGRAGRSVPAVNGVSLEIDPGEFLAITGPSGCGKSTLLHLLGGIDTPTSGFVEVMGTRLDQLDDRALTRLRLLRIGFVFQRFHLLPVLTAAENVELPLAEAGVGVRERRARVAELLGYVGLAHRAAHRAAELSGGEMQRVAIARALANRPAIVLADEPTGELDEATGRGILDLFRQLNRDGTTLVVVTHDAQLAVEARRMVRLRDGRIVA